MSHAALPWEAPPAGLALPEAEVHVWRAPLDLPDPVRERLSLLLSSDECARAGRFYFARDRNHFVAGRGRLRLLLSRYTGIPPTRIGFRYGPRGKPALADAPAVSDLHFNISHAHGLALFAFTRAREIGIDIEFIRRDMDVECILQQFFTPCEAAAIRSLPAGEQQTAFFEFWTRKEAYIKATGDGLAMPLDEFEVSPQPGSAAVRLNTLCDPAEARRWSLQDLDPGPGYAAALAVEGGCSRLRCWEEGEAR
jgi:4'-phosphopantetheinyl transferase